MRVNGKPGIFFIQLKSYNTKERGKKAKRKKCTRASILAHQHALRMNKTQNTNECQFPAKFFIYFDAITKLKMKVNTGWEYVPRNHFISLPKKHLLLVLLKKKNKHTNAHTEHIFTFVAEQLIFGPKINVKCDLACRNKSGKIIMSGKRFSMLVPRMDVCNLGQGRGKFSSIVRVKSLYG